MNDAVGAAEGDGFDDVGSAADAGVEQDRQPVSGLDGSGQCFQGGEAAVGLPAAVVGAVDAVNAGVTGPPGVLGVTDALDDQWQVGE